MFGKYYFKDLINIKILIKTVTTFLFIFFIFFFLLLHRVSNFFFNNIFIFYIEFIIFLYLPAYSQTY